MQYSEAAMVVVMAVFIVASLASFVLCVWAAMWMIVWMTKILFGVERADEQ